LADSDSAVRVWPALDIVFRSAPGPDDDPAQGSESERLEGESHAGEHPERERPEGEHWAPAMPDLRVLRDDHLEGFLTAFLFDYSPTAMVDTSDARTDRRRAWRVFFATPDARDAARAALAASEWDARVEASVADVEDEGWAERSQAELTAIEIGGMIVAPPWDLPPRDTTTGDAASDRIVIVIEPSMGFGTGHHQTTRLCLRALQEAGVRGKRVLDLGTGSGVLAIAAAKLGAASVLGVDDDPDAVDAARKNVTLNGLGPDLAGTEAAGADAADGAQTPETPVLIERADIKTAVTEPADVVLANLTGALLVRFAEGVMRHAAPGGLLILSGFTEDERFSVGHAFRALDVVRDDREDGWIGLTLRR
jgi:ribosomal protein L11 methyltransferase